MCVFVCLLWEACTCCQKLHSCPFHAPEVSAIAFFVYSVNKASPFHRSGMAVNHNTGFTSFEILVYGMKNKRVYVCPTVQRRVIKWVSASGCISPTIVLTDCVVYLQAPHSSIILRVTGNLSSTTDKQRNPSRLVTISWHLPELNLHWQPGSIKYYKKIPSTTLPCVFPTVVWSEHMLGCQCFRAFENVAWGEGERVRTVRSILEL